MSSKPLPPSPTDSLYLLEAEAGELLASLGISLPDQIVFERAAAADAAAKASKFPGSRVVLKIADRNVLHKSDIGGVAIVEKSRDAIVAAVEKMASVTGIGTFAVSEFVEHDMTPGGELLLGIRYTPDFGPVVTFGAGGIATEFFAKSITPGKEVAIFSPSLPGAVSSTLAGKAITPFITGGIRRQRARASAADLEALISRCMEFASKRVPHEIVELEINPLVPTGRGFVALDAVVKLADRTTKPEPKQEPRPVEKIRAILHPRSIAVAGVSKSRNPGRVIVENTLKVGFDRSKLWIIKPGETEIEGCVCVPDVASLPERVDLLVLAIAAEAAPEMIASAITTRKAESVIVIPGGMGEHAGSEVIADTVRRSVEASRATDWRGPVLNGGNCLGVQSLPGRCNTIFLPEAKLATGQVEEQPLAIVSQSGALAVALQTKLAPIAPRYLVSIGNQIDLTVGDYLQYLEGDPSIGVAAFYVEGFQPLDGKAWVEAAARMTASGRRVILYRAGRTAAGSKATATHTAAIAGDAVVTRELARAAGVLVAESLEEFEDLIRISTLLRSRKIAGGRIAAVSNAGFEAVASADNLGSFTLAELSRETTDAVKRVISESKLEKIITVANPLDVNPMLNDAAFSAIASALVNDPGVDAAMIGCVPLTGALATLPDEVGSPTSIVAKLGELWRSTTKPWVVAIDAGHLYDAMATALSAEGVPVFRTSDRALRALGKWAAL